MKFTHAGQVCRRSQVKKLRLVNKSWMRAVSGALRKEREPVFCLVLKKENSVLGSLAPEFENNGKLLHQFLRKWAEDAQLENGGSPFSLNIQPEFFLQENAQDLSTCLRSYGRNLMNLDVSFPLNGSMLFDFDSLSLEKLQILGVQFPYMPLVDASVQSSNMHTNGHTLALLRGLLEGAKELKEFQFPRCIPNGMRPLKFDEVTLSKSISRLTIDCPLQSKDLRVLLHNEFTNLSYLKLFATEQAYDNGIMYQILSRVKDSLKDLHLWGQKYGRRARNTTPVRFPLMKKLEKLIMTSQCWDLDNSTCMHQSGWHIQLPKLNDLVIRHITRTTLEKWTSQARYQSVEKLAVSLIDTSVPRINRTYEQTRTLPRSVMRKINLAFPNLVCLEMSVGEPGTLGLQYVFKEMHNLQKLAIVLVRENNSVYTNSVFWDRLLIGAPNGLESFKTFNSIDDENRPSIRKLTGACVRPNLYQSFYLICNNYINSRSFVQPKGFLIS